MRGMRARLGRDDGMTIVEVIVAAAILFFITTGVLGLLGRTTLMSIDAKGMNVATNVVNSYVEWTRSLTLAQIDGGSIVSTSTVVGEYTVTIDPTVNPGDNAALRNLDLRVTLQRGTQTVRAYDTMVVLRDRDQNLTESQRSPSTDPKIVFISPTPPDMSVLWYEAGSWWKDSGGATQPVKLAVKVTPTSGRTIQIVKILGHGVWPIEDSSGNPAIWENPTWTNSPVFYWYLNQRTILDELRLVEGTQEVKAYVMDSAGAVGAEARRTYIVDNFAPAAAPTPIEHTTAGAMAGTLTWAEVPDGADPSYGYQLMLDQESTATTWTPVPGYEGPLTSWGVTGGPMSRYRCQVRAFSPKPRYGPWTEYAYLITRPQLTGTYTVVKKTTGTPKGWTVTTTLAATAPTFPTVTGSTTYKWYADGVLLATTTTNSYPVPAVNFTTLSPDVTNFPSRTYTVEVTTIPAGDGGGTAIVRTSNACTTAASASGTYPLPEGTW